MAKYVPYFNKSDAINKALFFCPVLRGSTKTGTGTDTLFRAHGTTMGFWGVSLPVPVFVQPITFLGGENVRANPEPKGNVYAQLTVPPIPLPQRTRKDTYFRADIRHYNREAL